MKALDNAAKVWNDPEPLERAWETMDQKKELEKWVSSEWVGQADKIADLECGTGRYADVLEYSWYKGFDTSTPMIKFAEAKAKDRGRENAEFTCVDVLSYQSTEAYDLVLMMDVAQHIDEPLQAIMQVLNHWVANRYIFSVLVGPKREQLMNSTVIPYVEFADFLVDITGKKKKSVSLRVDQVGGEQFRAAYLYVAGGK